MIVHILQFLGLDEISHWLICEEGLKSRCTSLINSSSATEGCWEVAHITEVDNGQSASVWERWRMTQIEEPVVKGQRHGARSLCPVCSATNATGLFQIIDFTGLWQLAINKLQQTCHVHQFATSLLKSGLVATFHSQTCYVHLAETTCNRMDNNFYYMALKYPAF